MTRMTGSVPDARTTRRPLLPSFSRPSAQELACARNYVAANPAPAVGVAEVTAFFERGRVLVEE